MGTFSLNIGTITEATSYPLHIQSNFDDILTTLKDNVDKLIDPKDIRDGVLSIWENIPFKQTKIGTKEYIGFDTLDPNGSKLTKTIFIGKRSFSGTYSYIPSHDIMTTTLLNSDIDLFLYNTKTDTTSNNLTKISILSGKNPGLYTIAPYLQSEYVMGTTESVSIDFVTKVGNVNFTTGNYTTQSATFSMNNINIPTFLENAGIVGSYPAVDATTLMWRNNRANWEQLALPILNTIGMTGSTMSIFGTPVNVNGYSLELNTSDYTPVSFAGIPMGTTFNNVPIIEVLRRILYPYLGPLCTISTPNHYLEVGSNANNIVINYTINKRTNDTLTTSLVGCNPSLIAPVISNQPIIVSGVVTGQIPNGVDQSVNNFIITVDDGTSTSSASTFVQGIYPYFYGVITPVGSNLNFNNLTNLTKLVDNQGDKEVYVTGLATQTFYFAYDAIYPNLTQIIDENGSDVLALYFSLTIANISSPQSFWTNRSYKIYKRILTSPIGPPNAKYQFRY